MSLAALDQVPDRGGVDLARGPLGQQQLGAVGKELGGAAFIGFDVGQFVTDDAVIALAERGQGQRVGRRAVEDEKHLAIRLEQFAQRVGRALRSRDRRRRPGHGRRWLRTWPARPRGRCRHSCRWRIGGADYRASWRFSGPSTVIEPPLCIRRHGRIFVRIGQAVLFVAQDCPFDPPQTIHSPSVGV